MNGLSGNYEITAEASRAYNEAKGLAGEQPADCAECEGDGCAECVEELYEDTDRDALDDR